MVRHYVGIISDNNLPYLRIKVIRSTNLNTFNNRMIEAVNNKSVLSPDSDPYLVDWYCGYKDIETDEELSKFDKEIENLTKSTFEPLYEWYIKFINLIKRNELDGELFEFDINVKDNDRGKWHKIDYTNKEYVTCTPL